MNEYLNFGVSLVHWLVVLILALTYFDVILSKLREELKNYKLDLGSFLVRQ